MPHLARPVIGPIVSAFGMRTLRGVRSMHNGVDFAWLYADVEGSRRVYSAHPGVVVAASYADVPGYFVTVDIGDGYRLRYIHLSTIAVRLGQRVGYSTFLGVMGESGTSTDEIHLHLDLFEGDERVDPAPHLREPFGFTGLEPAATPTPMTPAPTPTPDPEENDDMVKVFERTGTRTREVMVVAPWLAGSSDLERGYRILKDETAILAVERIHARGSGTADKVDRDGYIAIQVEARLNHAAWLAARGLA